MSKCIFYGPSITQANHFSFVSEGTMLPLMCSVPMRGPQSSAATVLNLGDSAPVGVGAPPPSRCIIPGRKGSHLGCDTLKLGVAVLHKAARHFLRPGSVRWCRGPRVGARTNMRSFRTHDAQMMDRGGGRDTIQKAKHVTLHHVCVVPIQTSSPRT